MKTKLLLTITIAFSVYANSQTYVPDDAFEQKLIDLGYDTAPLDDYVPTANITSITDLGIASANIYDLTGIEDFVALTNLFCNNNQLTSVDLSANVNLVGINLSYNQLTDLDLSSNINLVTIRLNNNAPLSSLNLKNGNNTAISSFWFNVSNNPSLTCIEVDDADYSTANWTNIDSGTSFSENCATFSTDDKNYLEIKIYPNPTSNYLQVESNLNYNFEYQIIDMLGKKVSSGTMISNKINISRFNSGIYFIRLVNQEGSKTLKFIKQ